jgi:PIN domain nuclease of toxin-antitoxin system
MHILLDTHSFIWLCDDSPFLSKKAKEIIEDLYIVSQDEIFDSYNVKRIW